MSEIGISTEVSASFEAELERLRAQGVVIKDTNARRGLDIFKLLFGSASTKP